MAKIKYDADAAAAVKAEKDFQAAQAGTIKGLKQEVEAAKKADTQTRRFLKSGLDARGRYNKKLAEGVELVKRGKVTQEEATLVLARHRRKLDQTAEASRGAFDVGRLREYGGQLLATSGAVGLVLEAMQKLKAERLEAGQSFASSEGGLAQLLQLAVTADNPEAARRELKREASRFFSQGVGTSLDEAADQVFSLRSADVNAGDRQFAAKLGSRKIFDDVGAVAKASAALQTNLGVSETGGFSQIVSKGLAASEIAPSLAQDLVQAAAKGGDEAARLGLKQADEFLLTATAITGKGRGSASEGGTQVEAFLKGLEKTGAGAEFRGKTGVEAVRFLAGKNLDRAGLARFVGNDSEAIGGAAALIAKLDLLESQIQKVDAANTGNLGQRAVSLADSDPTLAAARQKRVASNRRLLQQEDEAAAANLVDAIVDRRATYLRRVDPGALTEATIAVGETTLAVSRLLETNKSILDRVLDDGLGQVGPADRDLANELLGRQVEAIERNNQLLERQAEALAAPTAAE